MDRARSVMVFPPFHTTALLIACAAALVPASAARAADWRITGTFSQGFAGNVPFGDDAENAVSASTSLGVTATVRTPTTALSISPSLGFSVSSDQDSGDAIRFTPSLRSSLQHVAPRLSANAALSVVPQFRSARTFDLVLDFDPDTGLLDVVPEARDVDPLQITINASAGVSYALGPRDSVNLGLSAQVVEYTETVDGLPATRSYGGTVGWSRQLTGRTSAGINGGIRRFETDSDTGSDRMSYSLTPNVSHALTPRHRASAGLGLTYVDGDDSTLGVNGSASLAYRAGDTGVTLALTQSLQQSDTGQVDNVTRLSLTASRRFTPRWSGAFSTSVSNASPIGSGGGRDRQTFTLGPSVAYNLTQNWALRGSYGLLTERIDGDNRGDNRFSLQLSRSFDF